MSEPAIPPHRYGEKPVLLSGSSVLLGETPLVLYIPRAHQVLEFELQLIQLPDAPDARYDFQSDGRTAHLKLFNMASSLGLAWDTPFILSGAPNEPVLYLNIAVYGFSQWRVVHYTFYEGPANE